MFSIPGFNPKSFSEDQLLEKMAELSWKISAMSHSANGAAEMMNKMLEAIQHEYRERQFMEQWKQNANYLSKSIETEPDLAPDKKGTNEKNKRPKHSRLNSPARSDKPVVPDKG
jgi:hypothetical protein